ncbi:uncharacterized protein LOC125046883 [Penaeus chinensis]|uniref:uncharacterized protein LOC125046883 n=1 Tax=Penaeus chinensis TaxID=139456 RepID=UPI001FB6047E|nr:uncharacterized protein LOC125046883 [Penaeus chinensis]
MWIKNQRQRNATAYPVGDAQVDRRLPVRNGIRLPYQERIRLKKVAQRKEKRDKKVEKVMVFGTVNVGSLSGRSMELVDLMERRGINILCVQETKWKGCEEEEKEEFWDNLGQIIQNVPPIEVLWVGGDLNGHVGEGNTGSSESVPKQHRPLVCKINIKIIKSIQQKGIRKTKWWRLKESAKETLGESSGNEKEGKETWWWNEAVQLAVKRKKECKKNRDHKRTEETIKVFKEANKTAKCAVAKAKAPAYEEQYNSLENEGEPVERITETEVKLALRKMKNGKSVGPDNIQAEVWKRLGNTGVELLTKWFNDILNTGTMPEEWGTSTLIPIFKNKGDIQECGNYRGIKLMSHTMKIWERIMNNRIRGIVKISEEQFGFMPGRGTTDAIYALRLLMEKYREG